MARPKSTEPTPRQREILDWVTQFARRHRMPPTVREIGRAFGIKSSTVFAFLKELERKGCLRRGNLGARSLIITDRRRTAHPCCQDVPVLGRIAAGKPILAVEESTTATLPVRRDLLRGRKGYVLRVEGDSMIDAGILDGDCVIVCQQDTAVDGDIVIALIGDEATLKRFYRDGDGVRLEPANRKMRAIKVGNGELRIQGKVVGVQRHYDQFPKQVK